MCAKSLKETNDCAEREKERDFPLKFTSFCAISVDRYARRICHAFVGDDE